MHPLENHLRQMIAVDIRPREEIDTFQAGAKRKRTTIRSVDVIEVGALPIIKKVLDNLANSGITIRGVLKQGPLVRAAIRQIGLADCFIESFETNLALVAPTWLDDYIILPVTLADGWPGCVVFYYEAKTNTIVQITTSLEVSTSYNNPWDDDIRPELIEKTYGFFRSGMADYFKNNWGSGTEVGYAMGFKSIAARQNSQTIPAFIDQHRAVGRAIMVLTKPTTSTLVYSHAYAALDGHTLINPWDASVDTPVTEAVLNADVAVLYALEPAGILPKLPTLTVTIPDPMPPAVPVSPEKPMITLTPTVTINGTIVAGDSITVKRTDVVALAWTSNADEVFYSFGWGERAGGKNSKPGGEPSILPTSRKIYLRAISVGVPEVKFEVDVTVSDAVTPPVSPSPTPTTPFSPIVTVTLNPNFTVTGTWKNA